MIGKIPVALVVPDITLGGGVPRVALFLQRILQNSNKYAPTLISLATASNDANSVSLLRFRSWGKGVRITEQQSGNLDFIHAGAFLSELEFQRYRARSHLTKLLNGFNVVQIVAGTPAWAMVAADVSKPVFLQVATLATKERETRIREGRGFRAGWLRMMTRITNSLDERAIKHCQYIFTENVWMHKHFTSRLGQNRVIFAPPGIDTELFCPDKDSEPSFILSVGRFGDPRKNIPMLFKAYAHLVSLFPNAPRLLLVGESVPPPRDWELAESLGIRHRIDQRQGVTGSELASIYQNASLFMLSSNEEGLGLVILEAMASALPVIATRCGGPESIVRHGESGYLVEIGDWRAMGIRALEILESRDFARKLGAAGRRIVEECFSLDAAGRPFLEKYDQVCNSAQQSRDT